MSKDAVDYAFVNPELNAEARQLRQDIPMRAAPGALDEYIRCWSEDDVIDGRPCKALVVILKTRGCTWALAGGCTMCGYANESAWQKVSEDQLVTQFAKGWAKYDGEELVKIYTSGSFVDRHEVMPGAQKRILEMIGTRAVWEGASAFDDTTNSPPSASDGPTSSAATASDAATTSAATASDATTPSAATTSSTLASTPSKTSSRAGSAGPGDEAALQEHDESVASVGGATRGHTGGQASGEPADAQDGGGTRSHGEGDADTHPDVGVGGGTRGAGNEGVDAVGTSHSAQERQHVENDADIATAAPRDSAAGKSGPGVRKVAFESLPGFIQDDTFTELSGLVPKLEVGIGVESSNDVVLRDSINKGHGFATFPRAAAICKAHDVSVKAYLMCKPPFLTESDALRDSTQTIIDAAPHSNVVSLNPTNIQGRTVVDALHKRGSYRAPWLWTLVHAVLEGDKVAREAGFTGILKSDVIAAGQERGAHNCGRCDERVVKYLKKYKDTQDRTWLEQCLANVECRCRKEWELTVELGRLVPAYAGF